tara:strand:+ start:1683 stop:1787 length:105 start_codon:yes stop_codon:yes gene_type:complete
MWKSMELWMSRLIKFVAEISETAPEEIGGEILSE